jgi:DNA-binding NarL/FixJ family response regulator
MRAAVAHGDSHAARAHSDSLVEVALRAAARRHRGLSPVEVQVARLAAGGSNAQIAQELFISRSTVKAHLSHIYATVGVANRVELACVSSGRLG